MEDVMIRAEVHTDDFAYTAKFDATLYFQEASLEALVELAACNWGGDYPADEVARHFDGKSDFPDVTAVFADTAKRRVGFECHVHDGDALPWLMDNRQDVFLAVLTSLPVAGEEPYWDRDSSWTTEYEPRQT